MDKTRDKNDSNIYRVKGIPQTTITSDSTIKYLVDTKLYEDVYNGTAVVKSFQTLKKNLFSQNTINSDLNEMSRTIKPNGKYKLYK